MRRHAGGRTHNLAHSSWLSRGRLVDVFSQPTLNGAIQLANPRPLVALGLQTCAGALDVIRGSFDGPHVSSAKRGGVDCPCSFFSFFRRSRSLSTLIVP